MDPQEYEYVLDQLCCVKESNVQCFDSRDEEPDNNQLDEAELLGKVQEIVSRISIITMVHAELLQKELITRPPRVELTKAGQHGPLILM